MIHKFLRGLYFHDTCTLHPKNYLPTSVNDKVISPFCEGFLFMTLCGSAKYHLNKTLSKIYEFTVSLSILIGKCSGSVVQCYTSEKKIASSSLAEALIMLCPCERDYIA